MYRVAVIALVSAITAACGTGEDPNAPRLVAHVLPLQQLSLDEMIPEGLRHGFIRYEADSFAYEVPLTSIEPLIATAPIYIAKDGSLGSGRVRVYWVPSASADVPRVYAVPSTISTPRDDAVDLKLDLEVAELPRFAYTGAPGVLISAFLEGNLRTIESAYHSLLDNRLDSGVETTFQQQKNDSIGVLTFALDLVNRIRESGNRERLGPVSLLGGPLTAILSPEALELADRLVAGFLRAERTANWHTSQSPPESVPEDLDIFQIQAGLGLDYESEANVWFPRMAEEVTVGELDHAVRLSSFVSHATAVMYIAGSLSLVSGASAKASATTAAAASCSVALALAATTTVVRATGNIVRGTGALEDYEYDIVAPGLNRIVSQTLLYGLDELKAQLTPWANTGLAAVDALGKIGPTLIGWTDVKYITTQWMLDCYYDRALCLGSDPNQGTASPVNSVGKCNEA